MNASRDQVLLGLALQQGLITSQQADKVRDQHRQFSEANRPVSVSALLRHQNLLSPQQIDALEKTVDLSRGTPAPAAVNASSVDAQPAAERRRTTGAQRARTSPAQGVPVAPPPPVTQLGKYRLLKTLGQGGMGTVYLAEDTHLHRKVALKVLPKELAANRDFIKRFLAEARVTGKLSHPNIVVAYDIDSSQNTWFMAMEYLDGESLARRVIREGAIPWQEALQILKQVLKGLAYAHKSGIIHRDIKPDNLFLDKTSGETKILDLGLSKNLHAQENSALTQAGMILGTPNYLAPEQAENGVNVDSRADIYSLGATLYHLIVGAAPYDGPSPLAIIQKHLYEPFPDLRKNKPDIPIDVANLIWKMTAKRPADRFADCNAALQAVEDILEGRGFKLSDPLLAGGRRPGSSPRNRTGGSGLNTAVRSGARGSRTAGADRRNRTGPRPAVPPIALFSGMTVAAIVLIGVLAWVLQRPATPITEADNPSTAGGRPGTGTPGPTPANPAGAPAPTQSATSTTGANDPLTSADTDSILNIQSVAARGLTLSNEIDHQIKEEEDRVAQQRWRDSMRAGGTTTASGPTGLDGSETAPRPGFTPQPASGANTPATAPAPAKPVLHVLTAAERKTAKNVLDGFQGDVVFRMTVPTVAQEDIRQANIRNLTVAEVDNMKFLQLGPPPRQVAEDFYQGVAVQPDSETTGVLGPNARIRMIVRLEASDNQPVDLRLMHSALPGPNGSTFAGGAYASMTPCDYTLIDVPLQRFRMAGGDQPWFGYACGEGADWTQHRKLTLTISDVIVYNPK